MVSYYRYLTTYIYVNNILIYYNSILTEIQILLLLRSNKPQDAELISDISCTLVTFHEKTKIKNAVILKAMLDIFIEILNWYIYHNIKYIM